MKQNYHSSVHEYQINIPLNWTGLKCLTWRIVLKMLTCISLKKKKKSKKNLKCILALDWKRISNNFRHGSKHTSAILYYISTRSDLPALTITRSNISQARWFIPVIPALRRQRPDDYYKIKVNSIYKAISRWTRVIARNDLQQQNKNIKLPMNLKIFYIVQY